MGRGRQPFGNSESREAAHEERAETWLQENYQQNVQEFKNLAESYDLSGREFAAAIVSQVPDEDRWEATYQKFQDEARDFYGSSVYRNALADPMITGMLFDQWITKGKFKHYRTEVPNVLGPETIMQSIPLEELIQKTQINALKIVTETYGDELSGVALQLALTEDSEWREEAFRVIEDLVARSATIRADSGLVFSTSPNNEYEAQTQLLMARVIENPATFDTLTVPEKNLVLVEAQRLVDNKPTIDAALSDDLGSNLLEIQGMLMKKEGWKTTIDEQEERILTTLIDSIPREGDGPFATGDYENTGFFNTDIDISNLLGQDIAGRFGITHFREPGGQKVFTFDEEWAKQNLVEHAGIVSYLQDAYPDAQFVYGKDNGIIGNVFALLGRGTDDISSFFGAAAVQTKEFFQAARYDSGDREFWAAEEERVSEMIRTGKISPEQMEEATAYLWQAHDLAQQTLGWEGYKTELARSADNPDFGNAFGDATVSALSIYPGDREYETVRAIGALVGQIIFDPAVLISKPAKAIKLAGSIPKGAKISRSVVTQTFFDWIAMPPELLMATNRGQKFADRIHDVAITYNDAETFAVRLMDTLPNTDYETALKISRMAREGKESLHFGILRWWSGEGAKAIDEVALTEQAARSSKALNILRVEYPKRIKSIRAKIARQQARIDAMPRSMDIIDNGDGTQTLKGWHGRNGDMLPVNPVGGGYSGGGMHFGTWDAASERLTNLGLYTDKPFKIVDDQGRRIGFAASREEAEELIDGYNLLAREGHTIPRGLEIIDTKPSIIPTEVSGRFLGWNAPYNDVDANMISEFFALGGEPMTLGAMSSRMRSIYDVAKSRGKSIAQHLQDEGFDGLVYRNHVEDPGSVSAVVFDSNRINRTDDTLQVLIKDLDQTLASKAELATRKPDMIADKAFAENVLTAVEDFEPLTPLSRLPSRASLRKLGPATTRYGQTWETLTALAKQFSMPVFEALGAAQIARYLAANPKIDKLAARAMTSLRRIGHDTGTGTRLYFLPEDLPSGMLSDEVTQSYGRLRDFGRHIGADKDIIDEVLADILRAADKHSRSDIYEAFTKGYGRMVDSSKILNAHSKETLSTLWDVVTGETTAGMVKVGKGVDAHSVPTVSIPRVGKNGDVVATGVPMIEADMMRSFTLPTYLQIEDHVKMVRSMMRGMQDAGKLKRRTAGAYFGMSYLWRTFNAAWTRAVLVGRMPAALPLRIQLEQMIRIEAFGYASAVKHPVEWFKSVKGVAPDGVPPELLTDSPAYAFGVIVKDAISDNRTILGRTRIRANIITHPVEATRAVADRIKAYAASPSSRYFANPKLTTAETLEAIQADGYIWRQFRPIWDDVIEKNVKHGGTFTSYEKIVDAIRLEYKQVIGKGKGAKKVQAAIKTGRVTIPDPSGGKRSIEILDKQTLNRRSGKVTATSGVERAAVKGLVPSEDADDLADVLLGMYRNGSWKPEIYDFPLSKINYSPPDKFKTLGMLRNFSDTMFRNFYSRPDLYFGRQPLFRQIAAREFTRLRKMGFSETRAKDAATNYAARQVADILFTIGANSSADYWVRSIMPFFPAWKELATTWLAKIPAEVGGGGLGGWAVGAPAVAARIEAYTEFFQDTGILFEDGGQWRVKFGVLAPLVRKFTGMDVDSVTFSADSITSLLPTPSLNDDDPFYKGMLPSLGAPSGIILHQMAERWGGFFKELEDDLTLYGGNQSFGPAGLDYVLEAFGWTPFWTLGTEEMHKLRRDWATIDALRMEYADNYDSRPKREDYKTDEAYVQADVEWLEEITANAEKSSKQWYLLRGISSMFLPFSIKYQDDTQSELNAIWELFDAIDTAGVENGIESPLLEGFRAANPELELYLTGKTESLVPDSDERVDDYETFLDEIKEGKRLVFSPEQWLVWALGSQEAALHRSKVNEIFNTFANTPQGWLLSDYESSQALQEEENRWNKYLDMTEIYAEYMDVKTKDGQPTSYRQMYESFYEAQKNRYTEGEISRPSFRQQQAAAALEALDALGPFFGTTQYTDDSYLDVRRTLDGILNREYASSDDPVFKAVGEWWKTARTYLDEKSRIWDEIKSLDSQKRAPLYLELAALENEWATKSITDPKYGAMPSVQEVLFQRLSPEAQELRLFEWARLPVEFLSRYQREKVYGVSKKGDQLDELAHIIGQNKLAFDEYVGRNVIHPSSNEYEDLKAFFERKNLEAAEELNVVKEYRQWQIPAYKQIDKLAGGNPYWDYLIAGIDDMSKRLEAAGIGTSSSTAYQWHRSVVSQIELYRDEDAEFNKLMETLEIAYGEAADEPAIGIDLYWPLFFGGFPGFVPEYLNYPN